MQVPLLPRVARGDSAAVEEFLDRYGGLVWSLARRLTRSPADAEDAVQEIFIDLWRNAERYREETAQEATFVALVARRRLIDRRRKELRSTAPQSLDEQGIDLPAPTSSPAFEKQEDAARAAGCLERLKGDARQVLELSIYHGLPQARIAERIGLPLGTVKSHARRGLSQLRDCMEARQGASAGGATR